MKKSKNNNKSAIQDTCEHSSQEDSGFFMTIKKINSIVSFVMKSLHGVLVHTITSVGLDEYIYSRQRHYEMCRISLRQTSNKDDTRVSTAFVHSTLD